MKNILTTVLATFALASLSLAQATIEKDKMSVEFAPGTNISYELDLANASLAALGTDIRMDDEYRTDGAQTILEITEDSEEVVTFLVNKYFPGRSSVLAANFVYDDVDDDHGNGNGGNDDQLEDVDGNDDSVVGGRSVTLSVTLSKAAGRNGAWVALRGSNVNLVQVPTRVFVAAGRKSATFVVRTATVTKNARVRILGSYKGRLQTSMLVIRKR